LTESNHCDNVTITLKFSVDSNELVTIQKAAQLLEVGIATVYRWMKSGKIHALKLSHNTLVPKAEIERLKSDNRIKPSRR
jgi:excisionase family DNA binding protein